MKAVEILCYSCVILFLFLKQSFSFKCEVNYKINVVVVHDVVDGFIVGT